MPEALKNMLLVLHAKVGLMISKDMLLPLCCHLLGLQVTRYCFAYT